LFAYPSPQDFPSGPPRFFLLSFGVTPANVLAIHAFPPDWSRAFPVRSTFLASPPGPYSEKAFYFTNASHRPPLPQFADHGPSRLERNILKTPTPNLRQASHLPRRQQEPRGFYNTTSPIPPREPTVNPGSGTRVNSLSPRRGNTQEVSRPSGKKYRPLLPGKILPSLFPGFGTSGVLFPPAGRQAPTFELCFFLILLAFGPRMVVVGEHASCSPWMYSVYFLFLLCRGPVLQSVCAIRFPQCLLHPISRNPLAFFRPQVWPTPG